MLTKRIFHYCTHFLLEIKGKVEKKANKTYFYIQTDYQTQLLDAIFDLQFNRHWNTSRGIVRYHRQQWTHLCCLQKTIRWRYLSKQDVTRSLDLNVHYCLPTSVRSLRRQNFSAFVSRLNWYVKFSPCAFKSKCSKSPQSKCFTPLSLQPLC